jgi:hypothetical protein
MKRVMMIGTLIFAFPLATISADDSDQSVHPSVYNTKGDVSFYGTYDTEKTTEQESTIYNPNNKDNPYYGGANTIASAAGTPVAVLPNTGSLSFGQMISIPSLLLLTAVLLVLGRVKYHRQLPKQ